MITIVRKLFLSWICSGSKLSYWQNVQTKDKQTLKPDEKNKITYSFLPSDIIET